MLNVVLALPAGCAEMLKSPMAPEEQFELTFYPPDAWRLSCPRRGPGLRRNRRPQDDREDLLRRGRHRRGGVVLRSSRSPPGGDKCVRVNEASLPTRVVITCRRLCEGVLCVKDA